LNRFVTNPHPKFNLQRHDRINAPIFTALPSVTPRGNYNMAAHSITAPGHSEIIFLKIQNGTRFG
jgi:hypothetical protein